MNILSTQQKSRLMMALVASRPGLRSVEISDIMDLSIQMVMVALRQLVESCTLIAHGVVAPNGLDAKAYTIPGVACPGVHSALGAAVPDAPIVPAKPAMTNVAKAVEFIAANDGTATSGELHRLLGLKPHEYASSYLKDGVKDGRLIKEGGYWTVGTPPVATTAPAAVVKVAPPVAVPAVPAPALEPVLVYAPTPSPVPMPASSATPAAAPVLEPVLAPELAWPKGAFDELLGELPLDRGSSAVYIGPATMVPDVDPVRNRPSKLSYALWSDGTMHFAKDGVTVLTIGKADVKKMFAYLDNFAIDEEVAHV